MTQLKNRRKKSVTLIVAAGMTLAGTGVAFAYWTANGSGTGTAATGETVTLTITSEAPAGPELAPGSDPGQTVAFTVTNPGTGAQQLAAVNVAVAGPSGAAWTAVPGCSALDYAVTITDDPSPVTLEPGDTAEGTATITMNNLATNQDPCQGVTVPLFFDTVLVP